MVIFALPTVFHQDERYYAMGEGGIWKRAIYSASRVLITPNYHGHNTFNASEVLGRGISQGISAAYYPNQDRTAGLPRGQVRVGHGARRPDECLSRVLAGHCHARAAPPSIIGVV